VTLPLGSEDDLLPRLVVFGIPPSSPTHQDFSKQLGLASDSSQVTNATCTLQLIETMSNEQGIIESTIIIERKMFPVLLS
jgi:hypothetical protein